MTVDLRPMTAEDIDGVVAVYEAASEDEARRAGEDHPTPTEEQRARFTRGMHRFVEDDAAGAWVAVDGDRVVGMAEAIRRKSFWGLAMLFVDPAMQSKGIGRDLLHRTLEYAAGADVRMIMASPDPRALRRYSLAGLRIHPTVEAEGPVDRSAIATDLPGRQGTADDLDLVDEVDRALLGRSRAADVAFMLDSGSQMEVVDGRDGRGFALVSTSHVQLLGATDERTAAVLLWRVLALFDKKASLYSLTAAQDWAVQVCLAARLKVKAAGALFIAGMDHPPGPWIPSGWYF